MDNYILRKLQLAELAIMDEFSRICETNHLCYFTTGGTTLGAFRHHGFIPWDDDVDLGMPRKDYNKFIEIADKALPKNYVVQCIAKDITCDIPFMKICDRDTVKVKELPDGTRENLMISIDVFPYDNAVNIKPILFLQKCLIRFYRLIAYQKLNLLTNSGFFKTIILFGGRFISLTKIQKRRQSPMLWFNNKQTKYLCQWTGDWLYSKELYKREILFPVVDLEFEGKKYPSPADTDKYLTQMYGDYMKFPPLNKQIPPHNYIEVKFNG
jgi:lipopolysaccharide cholinephosphotransferase